MQYFTKITYWCAVIIVLIRTALRNTWEEIGAFAARALYKLKIREVGWPNFFYGNDTQRSGEVAKI